MRPALAALLVAGAVGLSACGDGEETTVVSTTTVSSSSVSSTTVDQSGPPEGAMTANGIGEASVGDSAEDVIAALGEPETESDVPGCELEADPVPLRQLTYELEGGQLAVNIDSETNEMTSYFTDSPELETELGDRVGDTWESLEANWSAALDPLVLGTEKPSPEAGVYKVGMDGENQLMFTLSNRTVERISGGYLPPCE